jgi:acylphosphatase
MKISARVIVTGLVQGVAYRQSTQMQARLLNVSGWVRNLPDSSVEGWFEGDEANVQALIEWCRQGPRMARVDGVQMEQGEFTGQHTDFAIRF